MVVPARVQLSHRLPLIGHRVIQLGLPARIIDILTGACYRNEVLTNGAAGVPMSSERHPGLLLKLVIGSISRDGHDLIHLKHGLRQLIEVTAAHYEHLGLDEADLDRLEVVGEVHAGLHGVQRDHLRLRVVQVEFPRVLLHDVDLQVRVLHRHYRGRQHHETTSGCCHWLGTWGIQAERRGCAITLLCVLEYLRVCALDQQAAGACEDQLLEDLLDDPVQVADGLISGADLALPLAASPRDLRRVAVVTVDLITLGALLGLEDDEPTDLTDEVVDHHRQLRRHEARRLDIHFHYIITIQNTIILTSSFY